MPKRANFNQTYLTEQRTKQLTRLPRHFVLLGVLLFGVTSCQDAPDPEQNEAGVLDQTDSELLPQAETQQQTSGVAPFPEAAENTREPKRLMLDLQLPEPNDPIADRTLRFSKAKTQPDYFATENQKSEEKKKLAVGARVISEPSLETHHEEWVKGAEIKIEVQTGQKKSKN